MEATMRIRRSAFMSLLAFVVLWPTQVSASDLTIRFQGRFLESTCSFVVGDDSRTIDLDPINTGDLPANGAAGFKDFSIGVENCTPDLARATFTFAGQPDVDDPLRYRNTGRATGVAVELQSAVDGRTIGADGTDASRTAGIVGARASLALRAAYWRVGVRPLGTGTVYTIATVVVTYD
jgi:type 1 fimbria pilin